MLVLPPGPWQDVHSVRGMNGGSESDLPQIKIWVDGSKSTHADEVLASSRSCQANRLGRRSAAMTRIWTETARMGSYDGNTVTSHHHRVRRLPCWCDH